MRYRKSWGILMLALIATGAGEAVPARNLLHSANRFVFHYRALDNSGFSAGFWERVAASLVLTTAPSRSAESQKSQSGGVASVCRWRHTNPGDAVRN